MLAAVEVIANYAPASLSVASSSFARAVVQTTAPADAIRAKALLFAAGRFACFCEDCGVELDANRCLTPSMIERFVASGCRGYSDATRATLRANLRLIARHHAAPAAAVPALSRRRTKAPYSRREIAAYLGLADAQPSKERRARFGALIALGAGAGLMGRDLRGVVGRDIVRRSGGVLVLVSGPRPRTVPVRRAFWSRLDDACAALAPAAYLIGGQDPKRRNVTASLIATVARTSDLVPIDTGRLRATWLRACAEAIGLPALLYASGITCPQRLGDIVRDSRPETEAELVRRLSGRALSGRPR